MLPSLLHKMGQHKMVHLRRKVVTLKKYLCSEITSSYIYMLMECGNLDLNRWLQKRSAVNPLERKLYWKNMLEAVQTIHKYGWKSITP